MTSLTLDFEKYPDLRFWIDSFSVPAAARADFQPAMRRNLTFIQTLPGFLWHLAFDKASGPAKQYYEQIGFDPGEATARWGVTAEIGQYRVLSEVGGQAAVQTAVSANVR